MRRRYDVQYDTDKRRFIVEVVDERGQRRQVEAYPDWGAADYLRTSLNNRLEQAGELLPERR
jgi:hypothetical protein